MNAEELEKRMDELALEFAKTHDEEVKSELEVLRGRVAAMKLVAESNASKNFT